MSLVAVTGGTGFVGRHLVRLLVAQGHRVRLLSRKPPSSFQPGLEVHQGDLLDAAFRAGSFLAGAETLFHCAGELTKPADMERLHVTGTARLIEAAPVGLRTWIQLSSVGAYGATGDRTISEDEPERPVGPYESTKAASDALVRAASAGGAFAATILRPSIIYGEGMPVGSLHQLFRAIQAHRFCYFGPPGASAPYVHVTDVARAMVACANSAAAANQTFILSDTCTLEEMIAGICRGLETPSPRLRIPIPLAKAISQLSSLVPGFPLTPTRVTALTSRTRYAMAKLHDHLAFGLQVRTPVGMAQMAADWRQQA